jgi:hypothetical protein
MRRLTADLGFLAAAVVGVALAILIAPLAAARRPHPTHPPKPTASPTTTTTPSPSPTSTTSGSCTFIEAQAWWLGNAGGTDFGHLHLGGCFPAERTVSGTVGLDIRVIVHNAHGATFDRIEPVAKTDGEELTLGSYTGCQGTTNDTGTTTCWQHVDIDTTRYDYDGRQELRLRAWSKTPDGNLIHVSRNLMWNVQNGKMENPLDRLPFDRAKGWYTGTGYCEADVTTNVTAIGPDTRVRIVDHADSLPVTHSSARLDPDFHANPPVPGMILFDQAGAYPEATLPAGWWDGLVAGTHRLVLRADCFDANRGSTNSGVDVVEFVR